MIKKTASNWIELLNLFPTRNIEMCYKTQNVSRAHMKPSSDLIQLTIDRQLIIENNKCFTLPYF